MDDIVLLAALLDSLPTPLMFVDTDHVIRYMNEAAIAHYTGGESLLGRSVLDCHNPRSCEAIVEILAEMQENGLEERLFTDDDKHRVYMRAVRDREGRVLGYYERYAPPAR